MSAGDARAPIGVYDSGVGGLSVLRVLREVLPDESWIYIADSGHAPYGGRDTAFLEGRARAVFDAFERERVQAAVIACNTLTSAAAGLLRERHAFPIVAMEPAIKPAVAATRSGRVLVLATEYTVASENVARLREVHGRDVEVRLQACPGLVEQIERGDFEGAQTLALLDRYLAPALAAGVDTVVLGCTHYPFVRPAIERLAGPDVQVIDPAPAVARQLERRLAGREGPTAAPHPSVRYQTTGSVDALRRFLHRLGERDAEVDAGLD